MAIVCVPADLTLVNYINVCVVIVTVLLLAARLNKPY